MARDLRFLSSGLNGGLSQTQVGDTGSLRKSTVVFVFVQFLGLFMFFMKRGVLSSKIICTLQLFRIAGS